MLTELDRLAARGDSFAFETTLSGRGYCRRILRWRSDGYVVALLFLSLPTPDAAVARVLQRVRQGGHDIPADVIRRRFDAGLKNLRDLYCTHVDRWAQYDTLACRPELLDSGPRSEACQAPPARQWRRGVRGALSLAAQHAHLEAHWAGTAVVTRRRGEAALVAADPAMYGDLIPPPFTPPPPEA